MRRYDLDVFWLHKEELKKKNCQKKIAAQKADFNRKNHIFYDFLT